MTCPDNCSCYHDQSWSVNIVECDTRGFTQPPPAIPMDATEVYLPGNRFEILGGERQRYTAHCPPVDWYCSLLASEGNFIFRFNL